MREREQKYIWIFFVLVGSKAIVHCYNEITISFSLDKNNTERCKSCLISAKLYVHITKYTTQAIKLLF